MPRFNPHHNRAFIPTNRSIPCQFNLFREFTLGNFCINGGSPFPSLLALFEKLQPISDSTLVIVDGELLKNNPSSVIEKFSDKIGIERNLAALNWHIGSRSEWAVRESRHKSAINSTSFLDGETDYSNIADIPKVRDAIREVEPIYNIFKHHII